ncbi:MAG: hypothetical protein FWC86_00330 [Coriobacteriia bacterium]|nr:hypothetical protein [Coriobacteriia bacterium]
MSKDRQKSTRFATLGRIQRTHGKDGEVSLRPDSNFAGDVWKQTSSAIVGKADMTSAEEYVHPLQLCAAILESAPVWLTPPPLENRHLRVKSVRVASDRLLVSFEGIANRTIARDLVGRDVLIERSNVPDDLLASLDDLLSAYFDEGSFGLGLKVQSESHGQLGIVTEVIETGANLVWVIAGDTYGEVLLPVIDDCIVDIDEEAGIATVIVMKGLINEN